MLIQPSITGLVFSDLVIRGAEVPGQSTPTDEGKVWGKAIGKLNVVWSKALQSYIEGEVRGTRGIVGAGARLGVRWTIWGS